jgi:hypothetical protein
MLAAVALVLSVAPAAIATPSQSTRPLAVSVPPEPTQVSKGATAQVPIRVLNPGNQEVTVSITPREVHLGSNGQVNIGADADPQWHDRVQFTPAGGTVGPQQFIDVVVTVDVPPDITSDLHFVGFVVSPVANAQGQVTVINEIGSFVTLDVPGPRTTLLTATLQLPGVTLGGRASGELTVANVGQSSVRFWGESNTTTWPGGSSPDQQRFDKSLLPTGTTRSISMSAKPAWLIGFVTVQGQVVYPATTESATTAVTFSKRVLVIDPRLIVVVGVLVLASLGWWLLHRRRHRLAGR